MKEDNLLEELKEFRHKISDLRYFSKRLKNEHDYNEGLDDALQVIDAHIERLRPQNL